MTKATGADLYNIAGVEDIAAGGWHQDLHRPAALLQLCLELHPAEQLRYLRRLQRDPNSAVDGVHLHLHFSTRQVGVHCND